MFASGDTVVVGLSGGADSMCLVSLLNKYKEELNISLSAVHINHCIRGAEADRDELFVRDFCHKNGIALSVFRENIPEIALKTGESIELCARRIRYDAFKRCGADRIATAHSASDRIETMLFNLSRGASLNGLCSIPPVRDNIVRPLINITRAEIEIYCAENNIEYITDSTNLTDEYTRNKFRHNVISQLVSINPAFEKNALRCIELLNDENSYMESITQGLYKKCIQSDGRLELSDLKYADICILRRIIIKFLENNSVSEYEYNHINKISESIGKRFALCLPGNVRVISDGNYLYVKDNSDALERLPISECRFNKCEGISVIYDNKKIKVYASEDASVSSDAFIVDADKVDDILCLRSRIAGDIIKLGRRRCSKPLKKLFNEMKIPPEERDCKFVLADEQGLIFAEAVGVDATRTADSQTKRFLIINMECG